MSFLGIDVGTGGTRALVIDDAGRVIASATEEHRDFASPQIGWAEQDPGDWWRACGLAVQKVLAKAQLRGDQIACVGFSGQMHGAVLLDERSQVVRPALIWCDVRTEKQSRDLTATNRRRPFDRAHIQPGAHQFHLDQVFVGPRERTRTLEEGPLVHAAQGLRPAAVDGREAQPTWLTPRAR